LNIQGDNRLDPVPKGGSNRDIYQESGEWRVESGEWRVESGEWRVEGGEFPWVIAVETSIIGC
jgi:hypothetical protein